MKVRISSDAPIISTTASATSAITSNARVPIVPHTRTTTVPTLLERGG